MKTNVIRRTPESRRALEEMWRREMRRYERRAIRDFLITVGSVAALIGVAVWMCSK